MKVDVAKSANVIDRRPAFAAAAGVALFLATILAAITHKAPPAPPTDPDADLVAGVSTALDRGQLFWATKVPSYRHAKVVLYADHTTSACGLAQSASGPFYCPGDELIYIDLSFLRAIKGELAQAYVVAHELGHHVQKLRKEIDGASIPVELGADCYAGEWMREEQLAGRLDAGDVPAALAEAAAVGDDRLCPTCSPEQWTHGSAAQRDAAVTAGLAGSCVAPRL